MIKEKALTKLAFGIKPRGWWRDLSMCGWSSLKNRFYITDKEIRERRQFFTCAVCGAGPDADIRHISIDCSYAVDEVSPKFVEGGRGLYRIQVCKGCRAMFLFTHLARFMDAKGRLADLRLDTDGILEL